MSRAQEIPQGEVILLNRREGWVHVGHLHPDSYPRGLKKPCLWVYSHTKEVRSLGNPRKEDLQGWVGGTGLHWQDSLSGRWKMGWVTSKAPSILNVVGPDYSQILVPGPCPALLPATFPGPGKAETQGVQLLWLCGLG